MATDMQKAALVREAMLELQVRRGRLSKVTVDDVERVLSAVDHLGIEPHKPGENHQYRLKCEICGQPGVIRVTVDPERVPE